MSHTTPARRNKEKIKCPKCGKEASELQAASRDYTSVCRDCFAKSFVESIFKK